MPSSRTPSWGEQLDIPHNWVPLMCLGALGLLYAGTALWPLWQKGAAG